jgi:hypothetical protein
MPSRGGYRIDSEPGRIVVYSGTLEVCRQETLLAVAEHHLFSLESGEVQEAAEVQTTGWSSGPRIVNGWTTPWPRDATPARTRSGGRDSGISRPLAAKSKPGIAGCVRPLPSGSRTSSQC